MLRYPAAAVDPLLVPARVRVHCSSPLVATVAAGLLDPTPAKHSRDPVSDGVEYLEVNVADETGVAHDLAVAEKLGSNPQDWEVRGRWFGLYRMVLARNVSVHSYHNDLGVWRWCQESYRTGGVKADRLSEEADLGVSYD